MTAVATHTDGARAFPVLDDARPNDMSLPAFMVSTTRGFLPRAEPVSTLPVEFDILESLLTRMPIVKADGSAGLLASGEFGAALESELPDLSDSIEMYKHNQPLMNALYRDYSFLASAYLLEPCHQRYLKGESYGLGRDRLPRSISLPIVKVAAITGFKPFMEYAGSYALFNYKLLDPSKGLEYDNVALIRAFEQGLDRTSSEAGFVLIHIAMVRHSHALVSAALDVLSGAADSDRARLIDGLNGCTEALILINKVMNEMWTRSKPKDYTTFRTFIFGITNQTMFPNGVMYEGVSDEPMYFRGESGANDSMIPLCDNLLQVVMPDTPLTAILRDFRSYRPGNHREFLEWVANRAATVNVRSFALADAHSALAYLQVLDQVRDFRWRHWNFTREYILRHSKHKTATGGSPIVKWLPNQLESVLEQLVAIAPLCPADHPSTIAIADQAASQLASLRKDVERYLSQQDS